MKNKQPKFNSNSDVKMACTTKKRLQGTCPEYKDGCQSKEEKIKNTQTNLNKLVAL
ncbi:hypothetical protein H477_2581 [[Clostridium] sordellii ATCC 9714]|nr:hypothetical protein H477_2581 [[Clostridium] sordellii ATCC 9714] [Paeniclostridium sordellii ATCC 9714]